MLRIASAALFGIVTQIIRKLGPAVFVFAYIYLSHVWGAHPINLAGHALPAGSVLIPAVVTLCIISVAFRNAVLNFGKWLDARALPVLDQHVLATLYRGDLRLPTIRAKSVALLGAMKNAILYVALAALAAANSIWLALLLLGTVVLVGLMCLRDWNKGYWARWPHVAVVLDPENLAEIILVVGLLLGFMVMLPKGTSLMSGTIVIAVIARFSGQLKALAKELNYVRRGTVTARALMPSASFRPVPAKPVPAKPVAVKPAPPQKAMKVVKV